MIAHRHARFDFWQNETKLNPAHLATAAGAVAGTSPHTRIKQYFSIMEVPPAALITGAASGIGKFIALGLAAKGYHLTVSDTLKFIRAFTTTCTFKTVSQASWRQIAR